MAFVCLCGKDFTDLKSRNDHATKKYHNFRCACGRLAGSKKQLLQHRAADKHDFGHPYATLDVHCEQGEKTSKNTPIIVREVEKTSLLICFCLAAFSTTEGLYEHAIEYSHRYRCSCGFLFGMEKQLKQHRYVTQHERLISGATLEALKGLPGKSHTTTSSPLQARNTVTPTTGIRDALPKGFDCWCGSSFADLLTVFKHATKRGHGLRCSCGQLFGTKDLWLQHQHMVPHSEARGPRRLPVLHGLPHGLTAVAVLAALSKGLPSTCTSEDPRDIALATALTTTRHIIDRSSGDRRTKTVKSVRKHQHLACAFCPIQEFRDPDALRMHTNAKHTTPSLSEHKNATQVPPPLSEHTNATHIAPPLSENKNAKNISLPLSDQSPRTAGPKPTTLACSFCPGRHFETHTDLERHIGQRHPSCPQCFTQFHDTRNNGQLVSARQLLSSHQSKNNHCYCFEHMTAFSNVQAYEDHCAAHELVQNQCGQCQTILGSYEEYVEHCGLDDESRYSCQTCRKVYGCVRVYSEHCLTEHDLFVCSHCLEQHRSYDAWVDHMKLHKTEGGIAEYQSSEVMDEQPPQQQSTKDEQDTMSFESEDADDFISFSDSGSEIDDYGFDLEKFLDEKSLSGVWTDDVDATLEELLSWDKPVSF